MARAGKTGPERKAKCKRGHSLAAHRRERVNGSTFFQACIVEKARFRAYGVTGPQFDKAVAAQGYECAICRIPLAFGAKPCADHDHATGKFRGVLCARCNSGLGMFKDNIPYLYAAIDYLWEHYEDVL